MLSYLDFQIMFPLIFKGFLCRKDRCFYFSFDTITSSKERKLCMGLHNRTVGWVLIRICVFSCSLRFLYAILFCWKVFLLFPLASEIDVILRNLQTVEHLQSQFMCHKKHFEFWCWLLCLKITYNFINYYDI